MKKNLLLLLFIIGVALGRPHGLMAAPSDREMVQRDAYQLSISLLISAGTGNAAAYRFYLPQLQLALQHMPNSENAKKAWLLGRILSAAKMSGDKKTAILTRDQLRRLLNNNHLYHNAFYAWALGYLAAFDAQEYHHYKTAMLNTTIVLMQDYDQQKQQKFKALPQLSSDAMWAWTMDLSAAANAGDVASYHFILNNMKKMTGQSSIVLALATGLTKNDCPLWASSIVALAAMKIGDQALAQRLAGLLAKALNNTKEKSDDERLAAISFNRFSHKGRSD